MPPNCSEPKKLDDFKMRQYHEYHEFSGLITTNHDLFHSVVSLDTPSYIIPLGRQLP
jgi:hypothetical protein